MAVNINITNSSFGDVFIERFSWSDPNLEAKYTTVVMCHVFTDRGVVPIIRLDIIGMDDTIIKSLAVPHQG
jgi:hypothetical protein